MKKKILALAAVCAVLAAAGCNNNGQAGGTTAAATTTTAATEATTTEAAAETTEALTDAAPSTEGVMSHEEYIAAALDTPVTIEAYVQGKQDWWEDNGVGQASFYAQENPDGGYFFYNMPCTKEEFDAIVPGTKLRVSGFKSEWSGEIEITDAKFEMFANDEFIASAEDVTALLGTDELINHQNEFVSFKGMTVEAKKDADGNDISFMYKWDNSGEQGDDLYFDVSKNGTTYTFTVESYLCGKDTDVYKAVEALQVGDVIDLEGFLYWYNGANPHITSVKKAESVMSHEEYIAAELATPVTIEAYVQGKQDWWEDNGVGQASFYAQGNPEGGYFFYNMPCTKEEYDAIVPGTKLKVSGFKSEWSGEIEITDATFEMFTNDEFIATAEDVTALLGKDELINHQNEFVSFKGMTVEAKKDADGNDLSFMYKWDNSGEQGDDLYFDVSKDGTTYTFTVESYLCGKDTDVYKAVEALKVGDVIDLEGFLYWYNGANPHITSVKKS